MILPERVFGRSAVKMMSSGRAMAPIFCDHVLLQFVGDVLRTVLAVLQRDERRDRLALDLVRPADDRRFGDARVIDQRALHFHRADAVAGDVQHVVHAAEQPEVAVGVELRAVAGEVDAGSPLVPGTGARSGPDRRRCRAASTATGRVSASSPPPTGTVSPRSFLIFGR